MSAPSLHRESTDSLITPTSLISRPFLLRVHNFGAGEGEPGAKARNSQGTALTQKGVGQIVATERIHGGRHIALYTAMDTPMP